MILSDFKVDPDKVEPKYEQVKNILLTYIESLPGKEKYLPYEHIISKELEVGQITVKRALKELRKAGVIETVRKRGSKVINSGSQNVNATGSNQKTLPSVNTTVAMLLPQYDPKAITGHQKWRISRAFERIAVQGNCKVIYYSLCDPRWKNTEKLVANLLENNIRWAFLCPVSNLKGREVTYRLRENNIKSAVLVDSLSSPDLPMLSIPDKVDWVSCNYQEGMYQALQNNYTDMEQIVYIADESHLSWADERMKTTELFCNEHGIEYIEVVTGAGARNIDAEAVSKAFNPNVKQLIIGANDHFALLILDLLEALTVEKHQISVLGFDNSEPSRERGLSSFDHNEDGIAEALWQLCRRYLTDKQEPDTGNGRFIYPIYIPRDLVQ